MVEWCGHEMTDEEYETCCRFWGGDDDLATDFEIDWEEKFNKSAWYWKTTDCKGPTSSDYESRPDEFTTFGYTSEYEEWGQNAVVLAVVNFGLRTHKDIYDFFDYLLKFENKT